MIDQWYMEDDVRNSHRINGICKPLRPHRTAPHWISAIPYQLPVSVQYLTYSFITSQVQGENYEKQHLTVKVCSRGYTKLRVIKVSENCPNL